MLLFFPRMIVVCAVLWLAACQGPTAYLRQADDAAYGVVEQTQHALGIDDPFTLEHPEQRLRQRMLFEQPLTTREEASHDKTVSDSPSSPYTLSYRLSLNEALQVAAANNRSYRLAKEKIYRTALAFDLERDAFHQSFSGLFSQQWSTDNGGSDRVSGLTTQGALGVEQKLKSGALFATTLGLDLVKLLTGGRTFSRGIVADASIAVPLLRGAGREIVTEPLQQSERNVVYAIWEFERFKRSFAVDVASEYLLVLERMNQVETAHDNYQRLQASRQRARRLADAGRLPEIQVDQALQDELRARSRWVSAQQVSAGRLDNFKLLLGLPTDARIAIDAQELGVLDTSSARRRVVSDDPDPPRWLLQRSLDHRRDLMVSAGVLEDRRRAIRVAEDGLRAEVTLLGSASAGEGRGLSSADSDDARLEPDRGFYSAVLSVDLPIERTAERNVLRNRWLDYDEQQRQLEALEDTVKLQVRSAWRRLREAYETIEIETLALKVAQRRVASTDLFLQAGRTQIRDLLEAQDALVSARNALTGAQVQYRIAAMELQRDVGTLEIDPRGEWLKNVVEVAPDETD